MRMKNPDTEVSALGISAVCGYWSHEEHRTGEMIITSKEDEKLEGRNTDVITGLICSTLLSFNILKFGPKILKQKKREGEGNKFCMILAEIVLS